MSLYAQVVPTYLLMLGNLDRWLEEAEGYATERGFEVDVLLAARLSPDQFTLVQQLRSACDTAKLGVARLAAVEAPKHADEETAVSQLRARIGEVVAWIEGVDPAAFDGAEERMVPPPFMPGMGMTGLDYAQYFAIPNFYFHVNQSYAILRNNGVKLGKQTYLGPKAAAAIRPLG